MITLQNILSHELVGLHVSVGGLGRFGNFDGQVIYETKSTLIIRTGSGLKTVPKNVAGKINVHDVHGGCFINGLSLIGRPEDRITRSN